MTERTQKILAFVGAGIMAIVLLPLLDHSGRIDLFYPVCVTVAMIAGVLKLCWELHRRPWFWATMTIVVASHVLLTLYIPWRAGWIPAPVTIAVCMVDLVIVVRIIKLIARLVDRRPGAPGLSL